MTVFYFVKRSIDNDSFYAQLTAEQMRTGLAAGSIQPDWLAAQDLQGRSYSDFVLEDSQANWRTVTDVLATPESSGGIAPESLPEVPPEVPPPGYLPFSFGAAGLTPLWLMFHGERAMGTLLVLLGLALRALSALGGPGGIAISVCVKLIVVFIAGTNGSEIAMQHCGYRSIEELRKGERRWSIFGAIFLSGNLLLTVIGLAVAVSNAMAG